MRHVYAYNMRKSINFVYILHQKIQICKSCTTCESSLILMWKLWPLSFQMVTIHVYAPIYAYCTLLLLERDTGTRGVTHGPEDCFSTRVGGNRTADGYGRNCDSHWSVAKWLWPSCCPEQFFQICLLNALVDQTQAWFHHFPAFAKSTLCFINLSIRTSNIELFSTHRHSLSFSLSVSVSFLFLYKS